MVAVVAVAVVAKKKKMVRFRASSECRLVMDGWPAAGIKMLLMHLDGSPLSVLFWGRLLTSHGGMGSLGG